MKRIIALAALAATCSTATAAGAAAPRTRHLASLAGWASTATQGMPLRQNVTALGALPAATNLQIAVALAVPNKTAATAYLNAITTPGNALYGHYLTPAQSTAAFAPSATSANAVATYLASAGLSNVRVAANRLLVTATGSADTVGRAFNTQLNLYRTNGTTFYANASAAQVPASLAGVVSAVLGLSTLDKAHTNLTLRNARRATVRAASTADDAAPPDMSSCLAGGSSFPQGIGLSNSFWAEIWGLAGQPAPIPPPFVAFPQPPVQPPSLADVCIAGTIGPLGYQKLYGATGFTTGQNTDVAIIAEGDLSELAVDLPYFWRTMGIPPTAYTIVPTADPKTITDTSGIDEFAMDTEYSTGMAGGLHHLWVYDGPSLNDSDLATEINAWVSDDRARIGSMSIGGCEFLSYVTGVTEVYDEILLIGAIQGQALHVSSGDEGSACALVANTGTPVGIQSVENPASSPFVVAVGGTSLVPTSEIDYQYEFSWIGGGGGISYVEAPGQWQFESNVPSALAGRRGVPDIAYPSDPNFGGAWVYYGGAWTGVGGTSLATPLSAGAWARIQSAHANALGYTPAVLYAAYRAQNALSSLSLPSIGTTSTLVGGFNDIDEGSNGLYQATPAWDYDTGMGSINVPALNRIVR